jgi:hypothetical protein
MKRTATACVILLALVLARSVLGVGVGQQLYVKAKNTKLFASPSPTSEVVLLLQPGDPVVWRGPDAREKRWHRVDVRGTQGVIFQSNLSPQPPSMEVLASSGGAEVDPQAFASSGAATKAVGDAVMKYGERKGMSESVTELDALLAIAKQLSVQQIDEQAKKSGLFPVVAGGR